MVDRADLDYQTSKEFNYFSPDCIDTTASTRELVDRLDLLVGQIGVLTEVVTTGFAELKDGLFEMKMIAQAQQ